MPDKHKNFANIMNSLIGQFSDNRPPFSFGRVELAKETKELPNGNVEYLMDHTHKWDKEQCAYTLEVDNKTRRFVGWRYMSDPSACYVIP